VNVVTIGEGLALTVVEFKKTYYIVGGATGGARYNLVDSLRGLKGEYGATAVAIVALFVTIFAVGACASRFPIGTEGLFVIATVVMFLFVFLGWVDPVLYALGVLGGVAAFIVVRRWG